jgi:hypothetical protein
MFRLIRGCRSVFIGMTVLAFLTAIPIDYALSALVDTQALKTGLDPDHLRTRMEDLLVREDVRVVLLQHGISPTEVEARIAAMTDKELSQVSESVGALPAAADGAIMVLPIGLVILILLGFVLVLTGIIGIGAYAGVQIDKQKEQEYAKTPPFPAPPRVGPVPSVNPNEPWTGKWKVTQGQFTGVYALKQRGDTVISTNDSDHIVDAKVYGATIWGKLGTRRVDFKATIADDFLSFKGNVDSRYSVEGQKIESSKLAPEPSHVTPIEPDKIKVMLLKPGGWDADWSGPGRSGEGFCLFESRGEKVVAKISIIDRPLPNRYCERDVIISSDVVKFDSCRDSGITLQFDPNDNVYPFKGTSSGGVIYKLKAK